MHLIEALAKVQLKSPSKEKALCRKTSGWWRKKLWRKVRGPLFWKLKKLPFVTPIASCFSLKCHHWWGMNELQYLRARTKMWYASGSNYDEVARRDFLPLLQKYDPASLESLDLEGSGEAKTPRADVWSGLLEGWECWVLDDFFPLFLGDFAGYLSQILGLKGWARKGFAHTLLTHRQCTRRLRPFAGHFAKNLRASTKTTANCKSLKGKQPLYTSKNASAANTLRIPSTHQQQGHYLNRRRKQCHKRHRRLGESGQGGFVRPDPTTCLQRDQQSLSLRRDRLSLVLWLAVDE